MTEFFWNTVDLRTLGYNIQVVDGWDSFPHARMGASQYPYRHGEILTDEVFYDAKDISLGMVVLPTDANGLVTTSPLQHLQDNIDLLFGIFGAAGMGSLIRTMPDLTQREAVVKVIDTFEVTEQSKQARAFVVRARMPIPFWRELPQITGQSVSGSTVVTNNGNAPVQDFQITFAGAGSLTNSDNGDVLTATAACVLDMREWNIESGGLPVDNRLTPNAPWLFRLRAGANNLVGTGTVSLSYYHSWF